MDKKTRLREAALHYHEFPQPGKVAIAATKQMVTQYDLALAYSPGVAAPCEEIQADPAAAYKYTSKGNLVAVITNGTAVLGLGDIGPLTAKQTLQSDFIVICLAHYNLQNTRRVRLVFFDIFFAVLRL